jgi:hypothetical protein
MPKTDFVDIWFSAQHKDTPDISGLLSVICPPLSHRPDTPAQTVCRYSVVVSQIFPNLLFIFEIMSEKNTQHPTSQVCSLKQKTYQQSAPLATAISTPEKAKKPKAAEGEPTFFSSSCFHSGSSKDLKAQCLRISTLFAISSSCCC